MKQAGENHSLLSLQTGQTVWTVMHNAKNLCLTIRSCPLGYAHDRPLVVTVNFGPRWNGSSMDVPPMIEHGNKDPLQFFVDM